MSARPKDASIAMPEIVETLQIAVELELGIWDEVRRGEARRTPMFEFARALKTSAYFVELEAEAALRLVHEALDILGDGNLEDLFPDYDDPEIGFLAVWSMVVAPDIFGHAVELAKRHPLELPPGDVAGKHYGEFVSLCCHLQKLSGTAPIIISVEKFGETLGVSAKTITTYRRWAEKKKILELVEEGDFSEHRAGKYRVRGSFNYRDDGS
jgi:hypothetical protein